MAKRFANIRLYSLALTLLTAIKSQENRLKGVDLLRGKIRLNQGNKDEAREILKEELRFFPDNTEASELAAVLQSEDPRIATLAAREGAEGDMLRAILPFTMLSVERLEALLAGAKEVCEKGLSGNFVECGVSAGGSSALLAWVANKYSSDFRLVYCCDTFEGMPEPGKYDTHAGVSAQATMWGHGTCAAPLGSLQAVAEKLGVSELIRPVKGLFQVTLPLAKGPIGQISLLHLDGDWYDSTRAILDNLYDQTREGAYIQVDDYGHWDGCRKALDEFESELQVKFAKHTIDGTGIWFKKPWK